jgi:hypothetical protein
MSSFDDTEQLDDSYDNIWDGFIVTPCLVSKIQLWFSIQVASQKYQNRKG